MKAHFIVRGLAFCYNLEEMLRGHGLGYRIWVQNFKVSNITYYNFAIYFLSNAL